MYRELIKEVSQLGSHRVLLAGDFMLDCYVYGDAMRISPEAPVPVLRVVRRENKCGGAASVAADIAALGGQAVCIGIIGEGENGKILASLLKDTGADISGLITSCDRPTTTKQRLVGLAQHRHQQQLMRIDEESNRPVTDADAKKIIESYKAAINTVDIVCLQDYAKGMLSEPLATEFIRIAKSAGKKVLVDPPLQGGYSKFKGASCITPNRHEAALAAGFEIENFDDANRAAEKLLESLDLEAVIITMDKDGAYLKTSRISQHVPTIARNVYDVTGAGDVVLSALAVSLAAGWEYYNAVSLANIAGGLEVEKFGVATVSTAEIITELIARCNEKTGKIIDDEKLPDILTYHRARGDRVVFTNGCFDVLHCGHIEYLQFSRKQGDVLIVGLNSDRSVRENKGETRPINNQADRAQVLAALECVDYVIIFDEATPVDIVPKVSPDILVKGEDWKDKGVVGREFVEANGGKVVLAKMVEGKSSTNIISKMAQK